MEQNDTKELLKIVRLSDEQRKEVDKIMQASVDSLNQTVREESQNVIPHPRIFRFWNSFTWDDIRGSFTFKLMVPLTTLALIFIVIFSLI